MYIGDSVPDIYFTANLYIDRFYMITNRFSAGKMSVKEILNWHFILKSLHDYNYAVQISHTFYEKVFSVHVQYNK